MPPWAWAAAAAGAAAAAIAWTLPQQPRGPDTQIFRDEGKGTLVRVGGDRLPEAVALAAAAFAKSPVYLFIFGHLEAAAREEALRFMFERGMWIIARDHPGALFGVVQDGEGPLAARPLAAFFVLKPSSHQVGILDMARFGLLWLLARHGLEAAQKMVKAVKFGDEQMAVGRRAVDSEPKDVLVLERMVVRPDCQGHGIGSWALGTALGKLSDDTGAPCVLSTQEARNATFYSHLGFETVQEQDTLGMHSWAMVRRPRA